MLVWGYQGSPQGRQFLTEGEALLLLETAKPSSEITRQSAANFLTNELSILPQLREDFDRVAEDRCQHLVEAHQRYSRFFSQSTFEVVYPVLPMDVMGLYVLLPEVSA